MNGKQVDKYLKAQVQRRIAYQTFGYDYHPFSCHQAISHHDASVMEIFVADRLMVDGAKKWSDFNPLHSQMRTVVRKLLRLLRYASAAVNQNTHNSGFASSSEDDGDQQQDNSKVITKKMDNQVITFALVPGKNYADVHKRKTGSYKIAGRRERVMFQGGVDDGSKILAELFADNEKREWVQRTKRMIGAPQRGHTNHVDPLEDLHTMTVLDYARLCSIYTNEVYDDLEVKSTPISNPNNPVNPYRVFSLETSMRLAAKAGAHPLFYSLKNYYDPDRRYSPSSSQSNDSFYDPEVDDNKPPPLESEYPYMFPDNTLVWRVNPVYMKPENIDRTYWPCVAAPHSLRDPQRLLFLQMMAPDGDKDPEALKRAEFIYEQNICRGMSTEVEITDFEGLKARHKLRIEDANRDSGADITKLVRLKAEANAASLSEFGVLFSPDGEAPDAIRSIAKYMNEYLTDSINFCLPTDKFTSNLTRFGDEILSTLINEETLFDVNFQHKDALSVFLKNMHVYANTPFNPHTLNAGPPGAGKSFNFLLNMKWLIPGTYMNTTYASAKANVVPGNCITFINTVHVSSSSLFCCDTA